jgi:hypothetical protein
MFLKFCSKFKFSVQNSFSRESFGEYNVNIYQGFSELYAPPIAREQLTLRMVWFDR